MRTIWSNLGDPSLHFLAIAAFVVYLAFGRSITKDRAWAEAPLSRCKTCQVHFLPGESCHCRPDAGFARIWP